MGSWQQSVSRRLPVTLVLLLLVQPVWGIREERVEMQWGELGAAVSGREVLTILRSGTELEGRVLSVEAEALRMEVKRASGRYSKGLNSIARSEISVLRLETVSGPWRGLFAAIGGGGGAAAGIAVYTRFNNEANPETGAAIAAGLIGGGAALGFLAGRSSDKRALIISVVD